MATWAHGLPNPWNTVSAWRMVRASATTNHSSMVKVMEQLLPAHENSSCQAAVDVDQVASAASRPAPTAAR